MKNSNLILLAGIVFMSVTSTTSHAQLVMNNTKTAAVDEDGLLVKSYSETSALVNHKAERNFKKDYQHTQYAEWSALKDHSLMCRFFMDNILYRAFYTGHGQWIYTVSSYTADKLNREIYDKIKRVYYNSQIVFVDQIDGLKGKTIYVVEVQDEKTIQKIRVDGDELEIIQQMVKQ
jgi:hypothetical protein